MLLQMMMQVMMQMIMLVRTMMQVIGDSGVYDNNTFY
jgi:hypothetical protein